MQRGLVLLAALLGGGCTAAPPNTAAAWTYPLWGLPRDLADAPLTAINRTGFGTLVVRPRCASAYAGTGVVMGAQTAGVAAWIAHGFAAGVATNVSVMGIGLATMIGADLAYGAVVNPLQVALLRTGLDERYFKYRDHDEDPEFRAGEAEARERSRAFFPNWNALVAEPDVP